MKKMAIVCSYNELCGNATYAEVLRQGFSKHYDVTMLSLDGSLLRSNIAPIVKLADQHIADIALRLQEFDYVNIQFEAGLYGTSRNLIFNRVQKLIDSCDNLVFTMHRLDLVYSIFDKELIKKILRTGGIFGIVRQYWNDVYMAKLYESIIFYLKKKSRKRNINIMVHTPREKRNINRIFGFNHVFDFPITFFNEDMRRRKRDPRERSVFLKSHRLDEDDVVIGLFGFVSSYKAHETAINALHYLPANYKILIFGSQHPMSITVNTPVDPYLGKLMKLIDENSISAKRITSLLKGKNTESNIALLQNELKKSFDKRVFFAGSQSDSDFIDSLYCCDFAILPYTETNQSGSGIASLVLESKIKSLYSNNKAFSELAKYYPDTFETFDIGNFQELAYKIMKYNKDFSSAIDKCMETYNLENNILLHMRILEGDNEK